MEEVPEVRKQVRSPPRLSARQKKEARLLREASTNILDTHWVDIRGTNFNQPISDFHYKHHVSRLMNTYTRPSTHVDNVLQPISRVMKPITQLYGIHGLLSCKSEEELKRREEKWRGRVDIYEKLDPLSRQKYHLDEQSHQVSHQPSHTAAGAASLDQSAAPPPAPGSKGEGGGGPSQQRSSSHDGGGKRSHGRARADVRRKPSRRADFDGISENDLVANGLYALTPQQLALFRSFTDMISSFDNADMVHILEDALEEAQSNTGLDDYGGFA